MTVLRILNLAAWVAVLVVMLPAIVSILRGRARTGDPARLLCASFALMVIGFDVRWFAIPESETARAGLLVFGIIVAAFTIKLTRTYGRGDHVG